MLLQDPNERAQAEQSLTPFAKSTDYIPHLRVRPCCYPASLFASPPQRTMITLHQSCFGVQTILDASHNPYAQYFASSSLLKMVSEQSVRFAVSKLCGPAADLTAHQTHCQPVCRPEIKIEIRNYFLGYLQRCIYLTAAPIVMPSTDIAFCVHICVSCAMLGS